MTQLHPSPEEQQFEDSLRNEQEYEWRDDVIKLVCTSSVPNHPAYGLDFEEYKKQRHSFKTGDDDESIRICFRMNELLTTISCDLATLQGISHYSFLILVMELGLIHFQHKYHEEFGIAKQIKAGNMINVTSRDKQMAYLYVNKFTIKMTTERHCRSLTPTVPKWLGNAIKDTAGYLNMSTAEFAMVCWCIGVSNTVPRLPDFIKSKIDEHVFVFDYQFMKFINATKCSADEMRSNL